MISKQIAGRKDGRSSAGDSLRYGEGLKVDRETGEILDKSHRTRFGNFGLVDDGVYTGHSVIEMTELIDLASAEMQANCDLNTRVSADKKLAHFVVSYNQDKPSEAVLRDTEDSMLVAMKLDKNHFASFLHNDNGYWHLHIFASRIEKIKPHRGNSLWHDQINRDKVCREIEIRHGLPRDNGLHEIDAAENIVEVPRAERRKCQEAKESISDKAKTTEKYSGEKSFQTWCTDIRIGDRLKHAKNWQDLHAAAAAYGCAVKPKGAGFVICPTEQKGGIQLSKVGLKNLPAKFGAYEAAQVGQQAEQPEAEYKPEPTKRGSSSASLYANFEKEKAAWKPSRTTAANELRETQKQIRADLRTKQKDALTAIRAKKTGPARIAAVSISKMENAAAMTALAAEFKTERQALTAHLVEIGPGNTFRDYLLRQAAEGNEAALALAQRYGADEATGVSRKREADQLQIVATVTGDQNKPAQRLQFTHRIERSGTVIFDLGRGRTVTDNFAARQIQLNTTAANDPESIETALRFATEKFGNKLTLTGSAEFQRLAVETSVRKGLGIKFADPALEAYREKFAAEQRPVFAKKTVTTKPEKQNVPRTRKPAIDRTQPPAHLRTRLHDLSERTLDGLERFSAVLLSGDVSNNLDERQEEGNSELRRNGSKQTRRTRSPAARNPAITRPQPAPAPQKHPEQSPTAPALHSNEVRAAPPPIAPAMAQPARLAEARRLLEFIKQQAGARERIEAGKICTGSIKHATAEFAIQHVGQGRYVIHRQSDLSRPLHVGEIIEKIVYDDTRHGTVKVGRVGAAVTSRI